MEWQNPIRVSRIVLHDRPLPSDHTKQGTLVFSDGSRIEVADIPNDGSAKVVEFPEKTIQRLEFKATGATPSNIGLSEIAVFGPEK